MGTKRMDFVTYGKVEKREAVNLRGLNTDTGFGLTGMANLIIHSETVVMVFWARKKVTRPVPKGRPTGEEYRTCTNGVADRPVYRTGVIL